ncbi:MAG: SDR family oxidoreductase [Candidatus Omnitrophica bacterium]|nr:SDR family oxidoreductase [Candidatus Omnitrophota bacterium]
MSNQQNILVLGATGYVGGRLVPRLLQEGHHVRASGRSKEKLRSRAWASDPNVELVEVDVHDPDSLRTASQGIDIVFYLVHSMNPQSSDFESADRTAANNMVRSAEQCQVKRLIYLGGLGEAGEDLSKHLKSRHEVEEILKSGPIPVTVLRAAMIIGSGSASFEILRYLVDRLPVMVTPRWVKTPNQPIAIRNVIEYLAGCVAKEETRGQTYDIGGTEILSYLELMCIYAQEAGLRKRFVIPVPVLTPKLSSLWIHLVTPVPSFIAMPLAQGLKNPVVCADMRITEIIPQKLLNCREAIQKALDLLHNNDIKTHWADAGKIPPYALAQKGDPKWAGGTLLQDKRTAVVNAPKEKIWQVLSRIGGQTGWYHGTWLWILRGFIDRLIGGVGSSRGRRDATKIAAGDVLDFWRAVIVKDAEHLGLSAEMRLPGRATLDFTIKKLDNDQCELTQHARFQPHGLGGILYWYVLTPLHEYIFGGMIRKIKKISENHHESLQTPNTKTKV